MHGVALTEFLERVQPLVKCMLVVSTCRRREGVDRQFIIWRHNPVSSRRRQLALERVIEEHGKHFIMARNARQVGLCCAVEPGEVADDNDKAARSCDTPERGHGLCQRVRPVLDRVVPGPVRVFDKFVHEAQRGAAPESRLQLTMRRIAKNQSTQPVTPMVSGPCDQRGGPAGIDRFETPPGRDVHVRAQIHGDEHGTFALLAEQLRVCGRAARRDAPVNAARVIAGLVGPRLIELHAAAAETGHVGTGLQRVNAQDV